MKVSVIVPIYNTAEYLEDCIRSIINQTYPDLEIIMIDDASTDQSKQIARKLLNEDERLIFIEMNEQKGVGKVRNLGIQQATGDYLYFVDSDDILHEDAIRVLVENIGTDDIISGSISTIKTLQEMEDFEQNEEIKVINRRTTRTFKNRSVLKGLYSKKFIVENNLKFLEDTELYSERSFMYGIISKYPTIKYTRDSRYFKRKRKDPIHNPNLTEKLSLHEKIINYLQMYQTVSKLFENDFRIKKVIDRDLLNFYRKSVNKYFRNPEKENEMFSLLNIAFEYLPFHAFKHLNPIVKQEIRALKSGDISKFKRYIAIHYWLSDLKKGLKSKSSFKKFIYNRFFMKLPVMERAVIFESFMGKSYSCNPKAVYEYLMEHNKNYQFIWVYNNKKLSIKGDPRQVKRFSLKYYYYMARSKYWVFNTRLPRDCPGM